MPGCCGGIWSSSSPEEMTISSLPEEPGAVDAEGPGGREWQRQDPAYEELSPPSPLENHNFGIAAGVFAARRGGDVDMHRWRAA